MQQDQANTDGMKWSGNAATVLSSQTFKSVREEMGRRVADVMTPVPVLGVPALGGVCGLKTTGEDRTAGVLLNTWGLRCSVGVQTSPGISRPLAKHSDHLTVKTQYEEILGLTRSDNEKKAILKHRCGESKSKKEVTFKPLGGEASHNVTCTQRNRNGTYCFARAIETYPHFSGNVTKPKPAARYTNGSVVDSEAIGGISVDRNELVPIKNGVFHERDQISKQGQYAEHCGTTLLSSGAQHFGTLQKICNACDKRQSITTGAASSCENNPAANASSLKSALSALLTGTHFHTSHMERNRNIKPNQHRITDSITITDRRNQTLHLNEEVRLRKTACPACPFHSRHNQITLQPHAAGDQPSNQLANALHEKTVTIAKATIEINQDNNLKSFSEPTQDNKIPRPQTPQTATKSNDPQSHTDAKVSRSPQCNSAQYNVPQNACGSVHATPGKTLLPPTHSCAAVTRHGNATKTKTCKKAMPFNSAHMSTEVISPRTHNVQKVHPTNTTQVDILTNAFLEMSKKCPNSKTTNVSDSTLHHLSTVAPQNLLNKHTSDQATHKSTKTVAGQISLFNMISGPLFHESGATTTSKCTSISLKNSSISLKNTPATVSLSSSMWTENQSNKLRHKETPYTKKANHENQSMVCSVSKQKNDSKTNPPILSRLLTVSKKHYRGIDASTNNPESVMNLSTELNTDENKLSSNGSNGFVVYESKQHDNPNLSQVIKLQNLIGSSSSCLHGNINTEPHDQRHTKNEHEGHCDPSPWVQTTQETDAKTELFALGASSIKAEYSSDNQPLSSYSTNSTSQKNTQSRVHQYSDYKQLSFTAPVAFKNNGSPECNSIPPSSTLQPVAPPCLQSSEVAGNSTPSPAPTRLCSEDSSLTHSHLVNKATLFPPSSPRCWKPAILQQKLETVEASLAANKDRIATLLNVIHDLEMCHTSSSGLRCFKTGQDVKTCSTCQNTACIVYSVEYDFRQQERCFLEVLNFSTQRNNASSTHLSEPFNFSLLRNVIIKNLTKSKVKSKRLCSTMFKWLPRKIKQV